MLANIPHQVSFIVHVRFTSMSRAAATLIGCLCVCLHVIYLHAHLYLHVQGCLFTSLIDDSLYARNVLNPTYSCFSLGDICCVSSTNRCKCSLQAVLAWISISNVSEVSHVLCMFAQVRFYLFYIMYTIPDMRQYHISQPWSYKPGWIWKYCIVCAFYSFKMRLNSIQS